jgi:hypothetical protein
MALVLGDVKREDQVFAERGATNPLIIRKVQNVQSDQWKTQRREVL